MRVQHHDGQVGQLRGDAFNVTDAHTGIEEQGALMADDEVTDGFFRLVWFVDSEHRGRDFVDLEPGIGQRHTL